MSVMSDKWDNNLISKGLLRLQQGWSNTSRVQSRDLVDQSYGKIVSMMLATLEMIAQADPKYADILLLENYAAFQNSLYDLSNVVPTLAKFYHQASESYEQACRCHISMIIYIQFEKLFQFARKIEDLMYTITPEEIPFQLGLSRMDLRELKSSR